MSEVARWEFNEMMSRVMKAIPANDIEGVCREFDDMAKRVGKDGQGPASPFSAAMSALYAWVCQHGYADGAIEMIKRGMPIDGPVPMDGREMTPLANAAQSDCPKLAAYLIERGVSLEAVDGAGHRPLMIAARSGSHEIMRQLLRAGAELDAADDNGMTALGHAIRSGDVAAAYALLARGASPDEPLGSKPHPLPQDGDARQRMLDCLAAVKAWKERVEFEATTEGASVKKAGPRV